MTAAAARAVRFDRYGGRDVLYVADIDMPSPGPGEVVVEVRAAGINPGEAGIRVGAMHEMFPATFPSGEGSDLAGVVTAVGPGVTEFVGRRRGPGVQLAPVQPRHPHRRPGGSTDPQTSPIELGGSGFALRGRCDGVRGCPSGRTSAGRNGRRLGGGGRSRQPCRATAGPAGGASAWHRRDPAMPTGCAPMASSRSPMVTGWPSGFGKRRRTESTRSSTCSDRTTSSSLWISVWHPSGSTPSSRFRRPAKSAPRPRAAWTRRHQKCSPKSPTWSLPAPSISTSPRPFRLTRSLTPSSELEQRHTHGKIVLLPNGSP